MIAFFPPDVSIGIPFLLPLFRVFLVNWAGFRSLREQKVLNQKVNNLCRCEDQSGVGRVGSQGLVRGSLDRPQATDLGRVSDLVAHYNLITHSVDNTRGVFPTWRGEKLWRRWTDAVNPFGATPLLLNYQSTTTSQPTTNFSHIVSSFQGKKQQNPQQHINFNNPYYLYDTKVNPTSLIILSTY